MNRIAVGILCGRGETDEALKVIQRVNGDSFVETILPLFPSRPVKCAGKFLFYPPAAANRRGAARNEIVKALARLQGIDYGVILDDDTLPDPNYFEVISRLGKSEAPTMLTGKLRNVDGERSWDVCSFEDGNPVIVPYEFWEIEHHSKDLYFSGPQHIFNAAGLKLAAQVGYPDLTYGEDTQFCRQFRSAGGTLEPLLEIGAQLLHHHNSPNVTLYAVDWGLKRHL